MGNDLESFSKTDLFCNLICFETAEPLEQQINVSSTPGAEWYLPLEIGNCEFLYKCVGRSGGITFVHSFVLIAASPLFHTWLELESKNKRVELKGGDSVPHLAAFRCMLVNTWPLMFWYYIRVDLWQKLLSICFWGYIDFWIVLNVICVICFDFKIISPIQLHM